MATRRGRKNHGLSEAQEQIRLPAELKKRVQTSAARLRVSVSEWWRRAATAALALEELPDSLSDFDPK